MVGAQNGDTLIQSRLFEDKEDYKYLQINISYFQIFTIPLMGSDVLQLVSLISIKYNKSLTS